jgi:hypothetical protein
VVDTADSRSAATAAHRELGPEANTRLTAATALLLLVLLAAEGFTILAIGPLLSWHVFLGTVLVPPTLLKLGTTGYRFVRNYAGFPAYVRRGAPPALLRLLGPFVVVLTVVLFASGIAVLLLPGSHRLLLGLHKASFVLWFGAMTVHVLGHLAETVRQGARDWTRRWRAAVPRAALRQWVLVPPWASASLWASSCCPTSDRGSRPTGLSPTDRADDAFHRQLPGAPGTMSAARLPSP